MHVIYDIKRPFKEKKKRTLAPPIPYPENFFLHSALRNPSLTQEYAGYTSHTNRGKNRTEFISHTNQQHKVLLSLCTVFYR